MLDENVVVTWQNGAPVRISDVATAVTKGDLTRSIDVQAEGEVAQLKDNIDLHDLADKLGMKRQGQHRVCPPTGS